MRCKKNKKTVALMVLSSFIAIVSLTLSILIWVGYSPQDISGVFYQVEYIDAEKVLVDADVLTLLNSRYSSDKDEFVYCLYGSNTDDAYMVEYMKETPSSSDSKSVTYEICPKSSNYIGTLHSHPQPENTRYIATCDMSRQDIFTFGADGSLLSGIMCGENKIAFYENNGDFESPLGFEEVNNRW